MIMAFSREGNGLGVLLMLEKWLPVRAPRRSLR
jgi:hypothetical protein